MPERRHLPDTHLSSVRFRLPFDVVWDKLTNPLEFPGLYPAWTARVEPAGSPGAYSGVGPAGDRFTIRPILSREHGVIDFEVLDERGQVERSRSRLFPLGTDGCVLVHLAERWEGADDALWAEHRRRTDRDLENARRVVEAGIRGPE
jgi:hypothetical protein